MKKSKDIAGIVGPTLIVMVMSELKVLNPTLYEKQIAPVVYLSGVLLFVAGISIVRNHNAWLLGWQTCLTIIGWSALLLGIVRMFFPHVYNERFENGSFVLIVEVLIILLGIFLTYKAYWPIRTSHP